MLKILNFQIYLVYSRVRSHDMLFICYEVHFITFVLKISLLRPTKRAFVDLLLNCEDQTSYLLVGAINFFRLLAFRM